MWYIHFLSADMTYDGSFNGFTITCKEFHVHNKIIKCKCTCLMTKSYGSRQKMNVPKLSVYERCSRHTINFEINFINF